MISINVIYKLPFISILEDKLMEGLAKVVPLFSFTEYVSIETSFCSGKI